MASRKATLAADALQIYSIAKGIARDPGAAAVASLVSNLKGDLGRPGRPKGSLTTAAKPSPGAIVTTAQQEEGPSPELRAALLRGPGSTHACLVA